MTTDDPRAEPAPGFTLRAPRRHDLPLVLASPHSGRLYPATFLSQARLGHEALRRSEDAYVDELFDGVPDLGAPLLAARLARSYVDLNREPLELDPAMFTGPLPSYANPGSPRVRAGLGTVPRIGANGAEIYRRRLDYADARARIRQVHLPYHRALKQLLAETRARFGFAVLLDCHSMPSQAALAASGRARRFGETGGSVDVILGDCHGGSCAPSIVDQAESLLIDLGYSVARNHPYAGGFSTRHHGRPQNGVHALQIEINRALYMDEGRLTRLPRLAEVAADMTALVRGMGAFATFARAAE